MKKFRASLIYIILLAVVSGFHLHLETLILDISAWKFVLYLIYGLFFSFFLVIFIKLYRARKNFEPAVILLIGGLIFYFLLSTPLLLFKLAILEFFILGLLVALDNKKSKSLLPYFLLFGTAWGLDKTVLDQVDYTLDPIEGRSGYQHLSVRAAAAIIIDRLAGREDIA